MIINLSNELILIISILLSAFITWLTTYVIINKKYYQDYKKVEIYPPRAKIGIWFKWMFYTKLILSVLIAIFLPEYINLYYKSFLFDVFALMYIHSYSKGDIKKLSYWYNSRVTRGKMKRARKRGEVINGEE